MAAISMTIEEMQQEIRTILGRIGKADFYEQLCEGDDGFYDDASGSFNYWVDAVKEVRAAEQLRRELSPDEYRTRLIIARKNCRYELYRAFKFSAMLWEQLGEDEEWALDPLTYWEDLAKKATEKADDYERTKYAGVGKAKYEEERMRGIDIVLKK